MSKASDWVALNAEARAAWRRMRRELSQGPFPVVAEVSSAIGAKPTLELHSGLSGQGRVQMSAPEALELARWVFDTFGESESSKPVVRVGDRVKLDGDFTIGGVDARIVSLQVEAIEPRDYSHYKLVRLR